MRAIKVNCWRHDLRKAMLALAISLAFLFSFIYVGSATAPTGGDIGSATSLSFDITVVGQSLSYTFKAKDIGSNNMKLRIDMTMAGQNFIYIINGATQTVWTYYSGTWTDLSSSFST